MFLDESDAFLVWWRALSPEEQKAVEKLVLKTCPDACAGYRAQVRRNIWRARTGQAELPLVPVVEVDSKIPVVVMYDDCPA